MTRTLKTLIASLVVLSSLATTRAATPEPRPAPAHHRVVDGCVEQPVAAPPSCSESP